MNKKLTITLIVILSILSIALIILMILAITNRNYFLPFFRHENIVILEKTYSKEEFESIYINSKSTEVYLKESFDENVKIIIEGKKGDRASSELKNNTLVISKEKESDICIGFCNFNDAITVYLPQNIQKNLDIDLSSGDISIDNFKNINANLKTNSGDIRVKEINNLKAKTSSGEIKVEKIFTSCNIETTSGDVRLNDLNLTKNSDIKTSSGDITIRNINDVYIDAEASSGDIKIPKNNRLAENVLNIKTNSGDISVK